MIKSDRERKKTEELLASSKEMVKNHEELLASLNHTEEEIGKALATHRASIQQLEQEIKEYDDIKQGKIPEYDINHLGRYLIAARISKDLNQRQFAELIGVNEALVSRDEGNEYQGIKVERFAKIAEILGLEVSVTGKLENKDKQLACASS